MNHQDYIPSHDPHHPQSSRSSKKKRSSNTKKGLLWLSLPFLSLIFVLISFALINTVLMAGGGVNYTTMRNINFALGIIGFISVLMIPIGTIIGIILLSKRQILDGMPYDERSGKGADSIIPEEINQFNWGAAGLTWVWGVSHRVWISLLCFVPLVNLVMIGILGVKGNSMAWKAQRWESVDVFMARQNKWRPVGIVIVSLAVVGAMMGIFFG